MEKKGWKDIVLAILVTAVISGVSFWFTVGQNAIVGQKLLLSAVEQNTEAIVELNKAINSLSERRYADREEFLRLDNRVAVLEDRIRTGGN